MPCSAVIGITLALLCGHGLVVCVFGNPPPVAPQTLINFTSSALYHCYHYLGLQPRQKGRIPCVPTNKTISGGIARFGVCSRPYIQLHKPKLHI